MKKISTIILTITGLMAISGCNGFLDVVPDNVLQFEDLFTSTKRANNALSGCYFATPYEQQSSMPWTLGDEWVPSNALAFDKCSGVAIMRGYQNVSKPYISMWTGNKYVSSMYSSIRNCDMFIQNIDKVPDMSAEHKVQYKAQATFLKAYYLFWLVNQYGPVVIPKVVTPNSPKEDFLLSRSKVEDCFDYIIELMDEAIAGLKSRASTDELSQIDKAGALAIKARVLLYRASPFFNGNTEYYSNFLDSDGQPFFPMEYDREKWKAAADAADEAIRFCEDNGISIYYYDGRPYDYDKEDWNANQDRMETLYSLRHRITERWNSELIWGPTRTTCYNMADMACPKATSKYNTVIDGDGHGFAGASYQSMERFYTAHGLPLSEDKTVNVNKMHELVKTPSETDPEFAEYRGYLRPGVTTVRMYLEREPRFYADLGVTGGYYRAMQVRMDCDMYYGSDCGVVPGKSSDNVIPTGIAVQKTVHPESYDYLNTNISNQIYPAYPIIRLSDLYLMKAEALNEYYGPSQDVWDAINAVRRRAGIPDVEESWSNEEWVMPASLNKHQDQEGMREIILAERANEFAFEMGHRFYDMRRWKRSVAEFNKPVYGWNYLGQTPEAFFVEGIVQPRSCTKSQDLWPIDKSEMEKNSKLIQNPGW